jgi:hypothetical protein
LHSHMNSFVFCRPLFSNETKNKKLGRSVFIFLRWRVGRREQVKGMGATLQAATTVQKLQPDKYHELWTCFDARPLFARENRPSAWMQTAFVPRAH